MSSDCLLLSLPQGLERTRLDHWRHQYFELGEGEEQGFHRALLPGGEWTEVTGSPTLVGRPNRSAVWYRTEFDHPGWTDRTLLRFDGAFTAANVWLNGMLLGSHYGHPGCFGFDLSSFLQPVNVVAVCVEASATAGHLPPALARLEDDQGPWWPLGMVGRAWLERVGSIAVQALDADWRLTPGMAEATIRTTVRNLDARDMEVTLSWQLSPPDEEPAPGPRPASARWRRSITVPGRQSRALESRVAVDRPQLWWPWTLGTQPMYSLAVVADAAAHRSTAALRMVGVREIELTPSAGGMAWSINGRRHFPKGAVLPPLAPGDDADPIGAWRQAGLDLAVSRGQVPSERTAATSDAAGVLLVVDPPPLPPRRGDDDTIADQQREAIGLVASHPSAAVLLQRDSGGLETVGSTAAAAEPYALTGAVRAEVEAVRRTKFQPMTALVLTALPDLDEAEGALSGTAALADWTLLQDTRDVRLRFHVVNDDASVSGRALVRWRLRDSEPAAISFRRERRGIVDVVIPATDQPPSVYEDELTLPVHRGATILEVELERDGEVLSRLEYEVSEADT